MITEPRSQVALNVSHWQYSTSWTTTPLFDRFDAAINHKVMTLQLNEYKYIYELHGAQGN